MRSKIRVTTVVLEQRLRAAVLAKHSFAPSRGPLAMFGDSLGCPKWAESDMGS